MLPPLADKDSTDVCRTISPLPYTPYVGKLPDNIPYEQRIVAAALHSTSRDVFQVSQSHIP
jgi:hypothetical protein